MMSKNDWARNIARLLAAVPGLRSFTGNASTRTGREKPETGRPIGATPSTWIAIGSSRMIAELEARKFSQYTSNSQRQVR